MTTVLIVIVLTILAVGSAVYANDEANDARYRRSAFLGYCAASVLFAALAVGQVATIFNLDGVHQ